MSFKFFKNTLKIGAVIFIFLFLNSCASRLTKNLWQPVYEDQIHNFVISRDGYYVIFLGDKYHYILDDPSGMLKEILFSKYRYLIYLDSKGSKFKLFNNNMLEANISIHVNTHRPPLDAARYFIAHGFKDSPSTELFAKYKFRGRRYEALRQLSLYTHSLNRPYHINVRRVDSKPTPDKILLTPFTAIIDLVANSIRLIFFPLYT